MFDHLRKNRKKSIFFTLRGVAQLVARDVWDVDAAGSNPVTPTISSVHNDFQLWTLIHFASYFLYGA